MRANRLLHALACTLFLSMPVLALAGGPLAVCSGMPVKYPGAGTVTLRYDLGSLSASRTKSQSDAIVDNAVAMWTNVNTATVTLVRGADLPVDVTVPNFPTYDVIGDGINPVIYDTDGSIIDALYGVGASNSILGFAGSSYNTLTCQYTEGEGVISGKLVNDATLTLVIAHEVGHLIGLDHAQLNSTQGGLASNAYPLMYPVAFRTLQSLHEDDAAAITALYPDTNVGSVYGELTGYFTQANGTPIRGANIWAQGTSGTFSIVSDYLKGGTGYFRLLLPPGVYTLRAGAVGSSFTGGSRVGPYSSTWSDFSFQPPLYGSGGVGGTPGTAPSSPMSIVAFGGGTPTLVTITAGCSGTLTFRIDGTGVLGGNCNVPPPAAPTTVTPTGTISTTTPTYTWNAVSGADSYYLLVQNTSGVAISASFTATNAGCAAGTGTCSITPATALTNGSTYNWFVNATNAGGTSAWSATRTITVSAGPPPPAVPTTISPAGAIASTTPAYSWNAVSGALSYNLLVQTSGAMTVISQNVTATSAGCGAGTGTCSVTPSTALATGTSYNWYINSANASATSANSGARPFNVTTPPPVPPAAPTPVSPTGTITTTTPTYTWNAVSGVTSYYLLVQNTAGVAVSQSYTATAAGCAAGTGTCSVTPANALANAAYNWFVNASNANGTSAWSAGTGILVNAAVPPAVPTTIAPNGAITATTPAYSWNAVTGAVSYNLLVQNSGAMTVISINVTAAAAGCGAGTGTCSTTPATALTVGTSYNWYVNSQNATGMSANSAARAFNVTPPPPAPPAAPTPVSPTGTITTLTPTYTWNASSGATSYYLLAQNTAGVAVSLSYTAAAAGCAAGTGTCSVTPANALTNGASYNWFVNASNANGTSAWSAGTMITVNAGTLPAVPATIAPSGAITATTPAYSWNAVTGAVSYNLLVQNSGAMTVISANVTAAAAGCGAGTGTCSTTPATALTVGTSYNWYVNAQNATGMSANSAARAFNVTTPPPAPPAAPTPVSPSGTITTGTPTYTWNASSGATSYYLLVQNTAGVAVSMSFTATAAGCAAGTGTCSVTPPNTLSSGAAYNWFVNASNANGTSAWSAGTGIAVAAGGPPAVPTTMSPGATIATTTPAYVWNASPGATSYMLLVTSPAGTVINTSYTATQAGCASGMGTCTVTPATALTNGTTYTWYVSASNASGTSALSAMMMFLVNTGTPPPPPLIPLAPTTVSPTGTITTTTPTFTWNASAGATSYMLLAQNTSGVAVNQSFTATAAGCAAGTGTCSVMSPNALSNGATYNWFVNASNANGTSPWSAATSITVSGAGPSVPLAPVTVSPSGVTSTSTPTYSWNASAGATSYYLLVQNTAGVAVSVSYMAAEVGCAAGTGTCSIMPATPLSSGASYNWFVNASNSLGTSPWSAARSISISAAGPSVPLAPVLGVPNGNTGTTMPTYTWQASAGATSYYLLVQNTAGVAVSQSYSAAAANCPSGTGTCSVMPGVSLMGATTYVWFVNASNSLGTSAWSAGNTIHTP